MQHPSIAIFGEVLFDRFEDGAQILGGAPFNVAWHLQAFAESPLFISRVGADNAGSQIKTAMQDWGLSLQALQTDALHATGTVSVSLQAGEPSYAILDQQAYDFIADDTIFQQNFQIIYHGSLALRHQISATAFDVLCQRHSGLVFMDVNLRDPWWHADNVLAWMRKADWVKLNIDEFCCLFGEIADLATAMAEVLQQYQLTGLIVTAGAAGASVLSRQSELLQIKPAPDIAVLDCVGAGDAFSAIFVLGLLRQWPLAVTLQRAQDFASAVVGLRGAVVQDQAFYRSFIEQWRA